MGALRFAKLAAPAAKPVYALGGLTAQTACKVGRSGGFAAVEGMTVFGPEIRT
jgi:thiamine monophosphate synthase